MSGELDPRAAGARRLKGKVCVVTGAGQGIGRATARRLGQEGGKIVIADRVDKGATEDGVAPMRGRCDQDACRCEHLCGGSGIDASRSGRVWSYRRARQQCRRYDLDQAVPPLYRVSYLYL
jgi:NAD(P)-dependent dehydrogenase (short-subunit alcohol dehydrogenase family)